MLENDGAGAGDGDKTGIGAPDGGSSEDGSENDDKPVTAKQLKAALASQKRHYEGQLQSQRAEFESFKDGVGKRVDKPADQPTSRDLGSSEQTTRRIAESRPTLQPCRPEGNAPIRVSTRAAL